MNITNAKYFKDLSETNSSIGATINGQEMTVPLDPDNTHYAEILRQVDAGTITIEDAD